MNLDEIKTILGNHAKWLAGDGGSKADMCRANLRGANLRGANLAWADMRGADMRWADLREADLRGANLRGANLAWADMRGADMRGADMRGANLREANLTWADMRRADMRRADLREADLRGAKIDEPVCRMDFGGWSICVRTDATSIGCQTHLNDDWLRWQPCDVAYMDDNASAWWAVHGDAVKAAIWCVMAKASATKCEVTPENPAERGKDHE